MRQETCDKTRFVNLVNTTCLSSSGHDGHTGRVCGGCTERSGVCCTGSSSHTDDDGGGGAPCRAQSGGGSCS